MASYTARGGSESQSDKEVRYKQERATQTLIRVENLGMNSGVEDSPGCSGMYQTNIRWQHAVIYSIATVLGARLRVPHKVLDFL